MPRAVLLCVPDLFFLARIETTARHLGLATRTVTALEELGRGDDFHGCLVELDDPAGTGMAFARRFLEAGCGREHPLVGFLAHVRQELRREALALGCHEVMTRGQLTAGLPALLSRLAGSEVAP